MEKKRIDTTSIVRSYTDLEKPKATKPSMKMIVICGVILISLFAISQRQSIENVIERSITEFYKSISTGKPVPIIRETKDAIYSYYEGEVSKWPRSKDIIFGVLEDNPIKIMFNDATDAKISLSVEIVIPPNAYGIGRTIQIHRSYEEFKARVVIPTVENSLRLSAAMMSSWESYYEKRPLFFKWSIDQIRNGLYVVENLEQPVINPITKKKETRYYSHIKTFEHNRTPYRLHNRLSNTGILIGSINIIKIEYDPRVAKLISERRRLAKEVEKREAEVEALIIERDALNTGVNQ